MTRDGYRPPDLIPPALRSTFLWLLQLAAIGAAVVLLGVGFVALFR